MARRGAGGVYLGVGPDQNFSYIAQARPSLAILIDVRRDNLLLHLLFKAIFAEARSRVDYLSLLTGRQPPAAGADWSQRPVDALITYIDSALPRLSEANVTALRGRLTALIRGFRRRRSSDPIDRPSTGFIVDSSRPALDFKFNSTWPGRRSTTIRRIAICCWRSIARARARTSSRPRPTSSS
jgi:hypothetical protein